MWNIIPSSTPRLQWSVPPYPNELNKPSLLWYERFNKASLPDWRHESYQSAIRQQTTVEIDRKIGIFPLPRWWVCDYHAEGLQQGCHGPGSHCTLIRQSIGEHGTECHRSLEIFSTPKCMPLQLQHIIHELSAGQFMSHLKEVPSQLLKKQPDQRFTEPILQKHRELEL